METRTLILTLAILSLVILGVQPTGATNVWVGPAYDIAYDSFKTVLTSDLGAGSEWCVVRYSLTPSGSYVSDINLCEAGIPEVAYIPVASGYKGKVLYYWGCIGGTGADTCNTTDTHTVTLLAGSITTGAATDVNSNGFNSSVTAINGSTVWIEFGEQPGYENWKSAVYPVTDVDMTVQVIGAPLYGGEHVYFRACDETGCGAELDTTLSAVTTIPTPTFRQGITNITNSRFNIITIGTTLVQGYTQVTGATIFFAIMFMFFMIGIWMRTRSVRLIAIIGIMISPMIMYASSGLYLGLPIISQAVAQGLMAAGLAGVALSFIRR